MNTGDRRNLIFKKFISTRGQERLFGHLSKCIVGLMNLFAFNHFLVVHPVYFSVFLLRKKLTTSKQTKADVQNV